MTRQLLILVLAMLLGGFGWLLSRGSGEGEGVVASPTLEREAQTKLRSRANEYAIQQPIVELQEAIRVEVRGAEPAIETSGELASTQRPRRVGGLTGFDSDRTIEVEDLAVEQRFCVEFPQERVDRIVYRK